MAVGFYAQLVGREIDFFELTWYLLPVGALMVGLLWIYILLVFRPEQEVIPGLRDRARRLHSRLGPNETRRDTRLSITPAGGRVSWACAPSCPAWSSSTRAQSSPAARCCSSPAGFCGGTTLEALPWNIVLLFGGAMSLGLCLWQTGAAEWLAISWLSHLHGREVIAFVPWRRDLRDDHDQHHHERRRDRDLAAGGPRHGALIWGSPPKSYCSYR